VTSRGAAALLALGTALAGCGLKGPLYLPEKSREVVVRPAPGTPTPPATVPEPPPAGPAEASGEQPPPTPEPSGEREPPLGTSND
jgi:hypothetical protein